VDALGPDRDAQVLATSLRNPMHAVTAARLGCEVATVPGKLLMP
jgi:transaldolase